MLMQRTLAGEISFSGVALHSGKNVSFVVKPALEDSGIIFLRTDLDANQVIKAEWSNIVASELCTTLKNKEGVSVSTVEHLLSALRGLNIDNAIVDVSGSELPIMDGSSKQYVDAIMAVGFCVQSKPCKYLQVVKPVSFSVEDKFIYLLPSDKFKISCRIDFKHPAIGLQHFDYNDDFASYNDDICKAKTFGFLEQVQKLQQAGLVLGGSYQNALVLDDKEIINKENISYSSNEFVRHKLLDIIGDLSLAGPYRLAVHVVAYKSGHAMHAGVIKELNKRVSCFRIVDKPVPVKESIFAQETFSAFNLGYSL